MPESQRHKEWSPGRFLSWAQQMGSGTLWFATNWKIAPIRNMVTGLVWEYSTKAVITTMNAWNKQ